VPSVIYGILEEEKQRNLEMQMAHKAEIASLRRGSIKIKYKSGRPYYYLQYRQGDRIIDEYLGKDNAAVDTVRKEIEKRKYLQGVLKRLHQEYREICRIVKD